MAAFSLIEDQPRTRRLSLLVVLFASAAALIWPYLPARDGSWFVAYADQRGLLGIPNFLDVASNLAFVWIGLWGIKRIREAVGAPIEHRWLGFALAGSAFLTAFGSGLYHWAPSEELLFWDRLPMVALFSALIGLFVADRVHARLGLMTGAVIGAVSFINLVGWHLGAGTLKAYVLLQYGGALLLAVLAWQFPKGLISNRRFVGMLLLYALAKVFEMTDGAVFDFTHFVSGHTLKHFVAAAALACVFLAYKRETYRSGQK
jgi:hypothetical protein